MQQQATSLRRRVFPRGRAPPSAPRSLRSPHRVRRQEGPRRLAGPRMAGCHRRTRCQGQREEKHARARPGGYGVRGTAAAAAWARGPHVPLTPRRPRGSRRLLPSLRSSH